MAAAPGAVRGRMVEAVAVGGKAPRGEGRGEAALARFPFRHPRGAARITAGIAPVVVAAGIAPVLRLRIGLHQPALLVAALFGTLPAIVAELLCALPAVVADLLAPLRALRRRKRAQAAILATGAGRALRAGAGVWPRVPAAAVPPGISAQPAAVALRQNSAAPAAAPRAESRVRYLAAGWPRGAARRDLGARHDADAQCAALDAMRAPPDAKRCGRAARGCARGRDACGCGAERTCGCGAERTCGCGAERTCGCGAERTCGCGAERPCECPPGCPPARAPAWPLPLSFATAVSGIAAARHIAKKAAKLIRTVIIRPPLTRWTRVSPHQLD